MDPVTTGLRVLLSASDLDRRAANWAASSRFKPIAAGGRMINSILDFDDRVTQGVQDFGTSLLNRLLSGGRSPAGAPLPGWMEGANLGPPRELGFSPTEYTPPDFSGLMPRQEANNLYGQGQGMLRGPSRSSGQRSGVGVQGGQTVASRGDDTTGRNAAANMVDGWRQSANQQLLDDAQRAYQARASIIMR